MEERRKPEGYNDRTEHRALIQKTMVDSDGVVRRTSIGEDGTIYRTVIYPDGTVKRLKKAATPESIAAAKEAMEKLSEPLEEQMEANKQQKNKPEGDVNADLYNEQVTGEQELLGDAIRRIQNESRGRDGRPAPERDWGKYSETPEQRQDARAQKERERMEQEKASGKSQSSGKNRVQSEYSQRPREQFYDPENGGKHHKKKKGLGVLILILVIAVVAAGFWFTVGRNYTPGTETADLNEYYGLTEPTQAVVIIDNEQLEVKGLIRDDAAYLDYDTVQERINSRIYIDKINHILLYSMPTYTIRIEEGATAYEDNGTPVGLKSPVFFTEGDMTYVSLEFITGRTNMTGEFYKDPNRIIIGLSQESVTVATLNKAAEMRELGGTKSPIMTYLEEGAELTVLEVGDPWTKVASKDGLIGYVKDSKLADRKDKDMTRSFETPVYSNIHRDQTIHMAWFQSTSEIANAQLSDMLNGTKGLNVIAPTWLFIKDTEGTIASIATSEFVNEAHSMGLEVWGVANDFDGASIYGGPDSSEATYNILSDTNKRTHIEEMYIKEALDVGMDGINIDFENINEACGPHYIQFIRELSILCRNNNIVLSVDSYVPSPWTTQYHREEQGEIVDYVVTMAYDQTGSWSDGMGSNSDIGYVRDAVNTMTEMVDPQKLIMGIPFYTRIWEEAPIEGTVGTEIKCATSGMADCAAILKANNAEYNWSDDCGQYIATYSADGKDYTVWVEDAQSLKLKLEAIKSSNLAGWSCWKLGQETLDVWDILVQY